MKKILLSVGFILILLSLALILQTLAVKAPDLPQHQSANITLDQEKAIENLSQAIKIQTISYHDKEKINWTEFYNFHEFLEKKYPEVHANLKKQKINRLLQTWLKHSNK